MEWTSVIFSSALVSGIVSLVLNHALENKKHIKDKTFGIYMELIEQLDRIFPVEMFEDLHGQKLKARTQKEVASIERYALKVQLISRNQIIKDETQELIGVAEELLEKIESLEPGSNQHQNILETVNELNAIRDELIEEMNREINRTL